jgi:predicted nucleic acid-binding protein
VLQEFYWVTTRKVRRPLEPEIARREVERLASLGPIVVHSNLVLAAIDRSVASKISFWDGLVVECALSAGCSTLYSEDLQDGWEVDRRMRVVNPFAR